MALQYALIRKIPPTLALAVRCHTRVTPQSQVRFFTAMPRAPFRRTEYWSCGQSWRQIKGLLEIRRARDFSRAAGTFVQTMP
jgi:hypothetical protein